MDCWCWMSSAHQQILGYSGDTEVHPKNPEQQMKPDSIRSSVSVSTCLCSPHRAKSQKPIEQGVQQVVGHIWAKELLSSSLLLGRTSRRSAGEHKHEPARQKTTLMHKTWQTAGSRERFWLAALQFAVIPISLVDRVQAALMHRDQYFCLQEAAQRNR